MGHANKKDDKFIFNAPSWMKLDNAATIYPPSLSRKYAAMFRFTVTLTEKIDPKILSKALNNIMKRFPSFSYRLKQGLFWCYFSHIKGSPDVEEDVNNPMLPIKFKENKYFMFRIRYYESRIAIEIFHALTDGTGGLTFLLTLTAEYLRLKYGIKIPYDEMILNPKDLPNENEYEDSFENVAGPIGKMEHEKSAYHVTGTIEANHMLNIVTGTVPLNKLKEISKKYNCSITEFIASLMIFSIQKIQETKSKKSKKQNKPIKISVPVNLRKMYSSNTLRNFSSYVNVGIETKYGHYSLEEIIKEVKGQMALMTSKKKINLKITSNVKISRNYLVRFIPMFIKKYVLLFAERLMGDRYCSSTLSNIGLIIIPDSMKKYITKMGFIIGRSSKKPGSCACIGYNGNIYISFSRKIKESEVERLFFKKLIEMDIPVLIESNDRR